MTVARERRLVVAALAVPLAMLLMASNARGLAGQEKSAEKPAAAEKKERAKPRGRLPVYYSAVVSPEQRLQIYEIQRTCSEQILKLQGQLQALMEQRDAEVEAVLTPEQKTKVADLRTEAAARRQKAKQQKASESGSQSDEAGDK